MNRIFDAIAQLCVHAVRSLGFKESSLDTTSDVDSKPQGATEGSADEDANFVEVPDKSTDDTAAELAVNAFHHEFTDVDTDDELVFRSWQS